MARVKRAEPKKPVEAPPAGGWSRAAALVHPRFEPYSERGRKKRGLHAFALPDGHVLVRGGHALDLARARREGGAHWLGAPVLADELWNGQDWRVIPKPMADELAKGAKPRIVPRDLRWGRSDLDHERTSESRVALDKERVLVAGGFRTWAAFHGEESYDYVPGTVIAGKKTWQFAGNLAVPRGRGAAVRLHDGRVLFAGGLDGRHMTYAEVEIWEPMSEERAAADWIRKQLLAALDRNEKYIESLKQNLEHIRGRVRVWGEPFAPIFADELREALHGRRPTLPTQLSDFLRI